MKSTAVVALLAGALVVAWLVDKAFRYPQVKASQLGAVAPLWVPFALFVAACVGLIAALFWRAARRVEHGENLFAQRHRRRRGEQQA